MFCLRACRRRSSASGQQKGEYGQIPHGLARIVAVISSVADYLGTNILLPEGIFAWFGTAISLARAPFKNHQGNIWKIWLFAQSVGFDRMKISIFQNNLHTRHSESWKDKKWIGGNWSLHVKILRIRRYVHDINPCGYWYILITVGIPRPGIDSVFRDSGPIIPGRYSGSRDVSLPARISVVNRSSNVEGLTGNGNRSSIPIRNSSLCENKDYFEHKMYQQRFTSHVLGERCRKMILLRDWDLNTRFSMIYRKQHSEFHPNTQRGDDYLLKTSLAMLRITSVQSLSPNTYTVISEPSYRTSTIGPNCPTAIS
jgi:hypothetical protein